MVCSCAGALDLGNMPHAAKLQRLSCPLVRIYVVSMPGQAPKALVALLERLSRSAECLRVTETPYPQIFIPDTRIEQRPLFALKPLARRMIDPALSRHPIRIKPRAPVCA